MLSLHGKPFVHSSVHSKKSRGTPPPPLPACEAAVSTGGGGAVDGFHYTKKDCFKKALESDPKLAIAVDDLDFQEDMAT